MKRSGFILGAPALVLFATGFGAWAGDSKDPNVADLGQQVSFTVLDVDGEAVRTYRDDFAVPHIFAETRRGLFVAYGYAVAQDRLWQLEVNRRSARGRLAEIFGSSRVAADRAARTLGYTDAELDQQFAAMSPEEQEVFTAYVDGINRYITEVVVPDPANKLPFEFQFLNIGVPAAWTTRDAVAFAVFEAQLFLERGDTERTGQTLLTALIAMHGAAGGLGVFNDVQWINDPDAPTSVPVEGAYGKRQKDLPGPAEGQLDGGQEEVEPEEDPVDIWDALGVPTKMGSHGWVVSAARSFEGAPMLFGGPQIGFNAPELAHEVQLKGGGMNVAGIAFAGIPLVLVGRTEHIAWTEMTAFSNNVDTYVETTCAGGAGYIFQGLCTPYQVRIETILVKGAAPVVMTVERSVHGPVVATAGAQKFSRKSVQWMREIESIRAFLAMNNAHNIEEFEAAVDLMVGAGHFLYADKIGNIAYWRAGEMPVHPSGFDIRLPLPGNGTAEWTGELLPIPKSINPTRGWLANWNTKADADEEFGDSAGLTGKQQRVREIEARLDDGPVSLDAMRDIAADIARTTTGGGGRNSRFLKPYLFAAMDAVSSPHPLAAQARAVLEAWDGSLYANAATSTTFEAGDVIFSAWLSATLQNTFGDELGANANRATGNTLIHVLDQVLGAGSGVPPSRDYFNGANPNVVMSASFTQALNTLGPNPAAWSSKPRAMTRFRHVLFPTVPEVASMLDSNKGTYAQIVVLGNPKPTSENILTLGQSGFIKNVDASPVLDPHFKDQFDLYKSFQYKPMKLYKNMQLEE
jgi:penicillin amidase